MSTPEHDEPTPGKLLPAPMQPGPNGGFLRIGNPGNRGGRGRPHKRLVIQAGKDLGIELARLKRAAQPEQRQVTWPCGCGHTFRVDLVRGMDARTRIAYAQLLSAIRASDPDADEPPLNIMVTTGSAAEVAASITEQTEGIEYVDGTQLEPKDGGRRG